jgi:hypothetical protein
VEQAGGDADAFKATAHIAVEDLLTEDRPDDLGTGFDVNGIEEPG